MDRRVVVQSADAAASNRGPSLAFVGSKADPALGKSDRQLLRVFRPFVPLLLCFAQLALLHYRTPLAISRDGYRNSPFARINLFFNTSVMGDYAYIVLSAAVALLNIAPLSWQIEHRNSGPVCLGFWVILLNINNFVSPREASTDGTVRQRV